MAGNTDLLVDARGYDSTDPNADWAAAGLAATNLELGGLDDWFLPSIYELGRMYANLYSANPPLGGFLAFYYWSSSEYPNYYDDDAWGLIFSQTQERNFLKSGTAGSVRPVRAF